MTDFHDDPELTHVARRIADLGRRVPVDPRHKARLREELLRRHQDMSAGPQRAADILRPRTRWPKRLTLVAPPALGGLLAVLALLWGISFSGHVNTQAAMAEHLSSALAHTVPTVTAWRAVVEESKGGSVTSYVCPTVRLGSERLYIRYSRLYLYAGRWYQVTPATSVMGCSVGERWLFTGLTMVKDKPLFAPGPTLAGHRTVRLTYRPQYKHGLRYQGYAWVNDKTGLVLRLRMDVYRRDHEVSSRQVDYTYGLRGRS